MSVRIAVLCRGAVAGAALLGICGAAAWMQASTTGATQGNRVATRVTRAVNDADRVMLHGNVHPKARAEFDRGAVSDAQPITKMMLLLQRSPEQEAELRQL